VDTERSESEREIPEEPAEGEDIVDIPEVICQWGDLSSIGCIFGF
jgi:hypothetical protein